MSFNNKRLRLYGKPATKEEIAKEVARLLLGNSETNVKPLGVSEICRVLDFKERKTIYNYRDLAVTLGYLHLAQDGSPILPPKPKEAEFKKFDEAHPIIEDPLIADWKNDLLVRKGGNPLSKWKNYIRAVEIVCNTLKINPSALLQGLDTSEKYLTNFLQLYRENKTEMKQQTDPESVDMANIAYTFSKGIRDFMNFNNLRYRKGKTGVMSQKVPNHAKYGDIRLTDSELSEAYRYLIEKYGLDSDEFRIFAIGVESCSRAKALFSMTLDYTVHTSSKTGKTTYIMTAYESKTKHIKGGKWIKYITNADTQKSIDLLKSRGNNSHIYESKLSSNALDSYIKSVLVDLYVHLGKIPNLDELVAKRARRIKNTGNYWFDHIIHVLRHVGAHYWLSKKGYNYGLVAKLGGWNTIDELKNSYGEMPPEVVLQLLEDEK